MQRHARNQAAVADRNAARQEHQSDCPDGRPSMNVKKFSAQTSREALRMVRDALGADAVILSNRTVNGSVEVLALASADMASLAEPAVEKEVLPQPLVAALAGRRQPAAAPAPTPVLARSP